MKEHLINFTQIKLHTAKSMLCEYSYSCTNYASFLAFPPSIMKMNNVLMVISIVHTGFGLCVPNVTVISEAI